MDNQTKRDNFKRIGGKRVADCLESIRKLENLGNSYNYLYTSAQLDKMFADLERAIVRARDVLEGRAEKTRKVYDL